MDVWLASGMARTKEFRWYLDVGFDDNKRWLNYVFHQMKAFPPSALRLGQEVSTIGSVRGAQSFSSFQGPVSASKYLPDPPTIPSSADFLAREAFEVTVGTASDTHYDCRLPNYKEKNSKMEGWLGQLLMLMDKLLRAGRTEGKRLASSTTSLTWSLKAKASIQLNGRLAPQYHIEVLNN